MQLDLFVHNRNLMLRNDVISALRSREPVAVSDALAMLSAEYPGDSLLVSLATLLNTLAARPERFPDHDRAAEALQNMETVVVPAANRVLGAQEVCDWLAPLWRSMAKSAEGLSYDVGLPHTHATFMSLQGGDWTGAEAQAATIPSWRRIPIPLAWMAEARFGQSGFDAAWCLLAELAWIDASRFGALARRLEAPALRKMLDDFDIVLEPDDEADLAWFPAWLLVAEPAVALVLRGTQPCTNTAPERAARLIMDLLSLERQGRHADIVAQRKRFRDLHPGLFSLYMSTR